MAEAPTASRKRPAPDGASPPPAVAAPAAKKRARYQFASIDDYEKLEVLGEGAFSVVFKARHRRTGEKVAVKWVRGSGGGGPDRSAVFREAGCLAACRGHPSIVQIKDVVTNAATGDLFIVMELAGSSLRDWLTRPFSEHQTRAFMRQLLGAAMKLHGTRTLHRDIKPENILLVPGGALKICDFGCATPIRPPYPEGRVGTMQYCSPEQLMGSRSYGPAVDVWALGCVMAELLSGQPLFEAETEEEVLEQIKDLRDEFDAIGLHVFDVLPELSQAGREVLAGLMRFDPEERLTAADALNHRWFAEDDEPDAVGKAEYPGFVPLFSAA